MMQADCQEAVHALLPAGHRYTVEPLSGGLINHTCKVTDQQTGHLYLLQKINRQVFSEPEKIQANYQQLRDFISHNDLPFFIPEIIFFHDNQSLYIDQSQQCWRAFEFIDNGHSLNGTLDPMQAAAVAGTFARFTATFSKLHCTLLHSILPGFHDVQSRYDQFNSALSRARPERLEKGAYLISELKNRQRYAGLYQHFTSSPDFKLRVMHHDAKIANILFDKNTGKVICPVDLDTVMPGYFFSDLGDMIRSMAGTADENSTEYEQIQIRPDIYQAVMDGYTQGINEFLTGPEKEYLHASGLLLIYMQALRFMTDYLINDRYYRISYPEQNYDRAKNQFVLLNRLEEFLSNIYKFTC
jgi:thiamine kinase-like enzyme